MVEETVTRHGGVDILVNNAGLYASLAMRPFTEIPLEEWNRVMEVNVASMFLTSRAVVPVMREARRRQDREHLLGHAVSRRPLPPALRDEQGRDRRVHARAREGARQGLDPRELRRAGLHDVGRRARPSPRSSRSCATSPSRRGRSSATRSRRTSSAPSSSSARPRPTSSPARRWSSTAASTSIDARPVRASRGRGDGGRAAGRLRPRPRRGVLRGGSGGRTGDRVGGRRSGPGRLGRSLRPRRLPAGRCRVPARASRPGIRRILRGELTIERDGSAHTYGPASPGSRKPTIR